MNVMDLSSFKQRFQRLSDSTLDLTLTREYFVIK